MNFLNTWAVEWRLAAIKNGMRDAIAYRGEFIVGLLSSAIVPVFLQLMLWNSIFASHPGSVFGGMTHSELLAYTWTSLLFTQVRGGNYDFELIEMIRTGALSNFLLRPVGAVEFVFFKGFGEKLFTAAFCFVLGALATFFTDASLTHLILGMMLAILGNIIHYLFGAALAAVAFYWENAFAVLMVKNMAVSLLCGELIPLTLFPETLSWVWKSTPFYLFVFGPTQIALGKWSDTQILHEFAFAFVWIFVFWALLKLLWDFSIHRYQGIGG
jgi:ABC-2 type transport system permease protein